MEKLNYIVYCWHEYIRTNRLVGIFLLILAAAVLLFLAFLSSIKIERISSIKTSIAEETYAKNTVRLLLYSSAASLALLIPISALVLMRFQTVFYSYNTLWLISAILPITAFALTLVFAMLSKCLSQSKFVISAVLITILLLCCGNMGRTTDKSHTFSTVKYPVSYESSLPLLDKLNALAASEEYGGSITILAPADITAYSHMYSSNIKTLYGKDMWDNSMKPLTYNNYPEDYCNLYTWISSINVYGTFYSIDDQSPRYSYESGFDFEEYENKIENNEAIGGKKYFRLAKEKGIDVIVIYANNNRFDYVEYNYLMSELNLREEYFSINENEGYILLFLE